MDTSRHLCTILDEWKERPELRIRGKYEVHTQVLMGRPGIGVVQGSWVIQSN